MNAGGTALSVILPLADHRGFAPRSAEGWAGQTLAGERFEIVAVSDGGDRRLDTRVRRFLRPRDRLLVVPRATEIEQYQAGAAAARGDVLLFTESHCVPEPEAAEAVLRFFKSPGAAAGTLRSAHIPRSRLSRLEELMGRHEEWARGAAGRWANVSLRGFAVRTELFRRLGGFRTELRRFAETALAIELLRGGFSIEEIRDAVVSHGDCASIGELEPALLGLGRGRRAFLESGPRDQAERFLGRPDGVERAALDGRLARALGRIVAHALLSANGNGTGKTLVRSLAGLAPAALGGARGALLGARVSARLSLLRCSLPGSGVESQLPRFAAAWHGLVRCGELEELARRPLPRLAMPDDPSSFAPGDMDDAHFVGFHAREADARGSFRWSGPAGLVRLPVAPGDYQVRIAASWPPGERHVVLFFNGRRVPFEEDPDGRREVAFPLERSVFRGAGEQHLGVVCAPFVPRDAGLSDPRVLGLAFRAIRFVPSGPAGGRPL